MTGRPGSLREKRCILVGASGVFTCDHVASLFLDLSWGRTSWRKQHELPRMARKQKRHSPEEGTREKHTFQRPLNDLFSPNRLYLIFITSHQIMILPIISSLMKLYPIWANHLPKPTSEHCFMGTKVYNIRETFSYPVVMISFDFHLTLPRNHPERESSGGMIYAGLACGHVCGGLP